MAGVFFNFVLNKVQIFLNQMELDVHLMRENTEPWGFEIVEDIGIPLTIEKVYPSSPAHNAGLQPGDLITRLGDRLTTDLTLDAAMDIIADAIGSLSLGVTRGLYDPVLDDYDPIYEPIDPVDFDRRSATEVFEPQTFIEPPDLTPNLYRNLDSNITDDLTGALNESIDSFRPLNLSSSQTPQEFPFSRSVTASPFASNRVYRPFSTEPLEIPPLEDPIILNSNFEDEFGKYDEKENDEIKVETVFKLPVSKQYDPDWGKKGAELLKNVGREKISKKNYIQENNIVTVEETVKTEIIRETISVTEQETKEVVEKDERKSKEVISKEIITNESKNLEQTNIDLIEIEKTAVDIVEESIERAVSVTEEIQEEVEEELRASMTREIDSKVTEGIESIQELNVTEENLSKIKKETTKNLDVEESVLNDVYSKESRDQNKIEQVSENIEVETENLDENKYYSEEIRGEKIVSEDKSIHIQKTNNSKKEFVELKDLTESTSESERLKASKSEFPTSTDSKQMAYKIGLQTIPNIRGMVQSSHHFDLLLRTFFIHLTDVMVALSMFILTQPATELDKKAETIIDAKLVSGFEQKVHSESNQKTTEEVINEKRRHKTDAVTDNKVTVTKERKVDKKQASEHIAEVEREQAVVKQSLSTQEEIENKRISGAIMAQKQQRKSNELMQKMESVISEFETKNGIDDTEERRRSRSRSRIEEEVMNESDPLEWLDKTNKLETNRSERKYIQENSKENLTKTVTSVSKSTNKSKAGKQMYIATVESHVYTNKDAILEEQLSPTQSVQSTNEENSALEVIDTFNQNVAVKSSFTGADKKQAVEVISTALEVVQDKQDLLETVTKLNSKNSKEKVANTILDSSQYIDTAESVQADTEIKHKELDTKEANIQKVSVTSETSLQTCEVSLESTKELINSQTSSYQTSSQQELLSTVASESTEIISQNGVTIFEAKTGTNSKALATSIEDYKTTAVESVEVALEATKEVTKQKMEKQEAVSKKELLTTIASESTEIIAQEACIKSLETYEANSKTVKVDTEESFRATAVQSEILIEETNAEINELKTFNSKVSTSKGEPLSIAVAETTNIIVDDKVESFETEKIETKTASVKSEDTYKAVAVETIEVALEDASEEHTMKLEKEALIREDTRHLAVAGITETKVEQDKIKTQTYDEQNAALKVVKEQIIEVDNSINISESDINIQKRLLITDIKTNENISILAHKTSKLRLRTETNENGDLIDTPTPSTVPPTPLTDEYVFKLTIPLPKDRGNTPIPIDAINDSPDEDPHIVKKNLIPHIETTIEDQIIYDPPLQSPLSDKSQPIYTKPGLRGGAAVSCYKEYIKEIERKSSLLASAIDETIKSIEEYKVEVGIDSNTDELDETVKPVDKTDKNDTELDATDELIGFRTVQFYPEQNMEDKYTAIHFEVNKEDGRESKPYVDATGEPLGTERGIVDGLEDATVNYEIAKELGKPGITEEKIAELISGESEMLREAHVMGLSRVLSSHMHRPDDSVDFQKIKPLVDSLNNSEVLKALNEELKKKQEEKKIKDDKKWTTFLQKPKRPVPSVKFGYHGYIEQEVFEKEPYKVKIVKQPKPKVAPDYKPEDFETGPLPWEERALNEPSPPPVEPEDPILIPEGTPEFLEALDPLQESEVPDLEDTGIVLPPSRQLTTPEAPKEDTDPVGEEEGEKEEVEEVVEEDSETEQKREEMPAPEQGADKLVECVRNMVDPSAPLEQQLTVMRAQLAALAQLPCVIQQSLDMLTAQLMNLQHTETTQVQTITNECKLIEEYHEQEQHEETTITSETSETHDVSDSENVTIEEVLPSIEEGKEDNSPVSEEDKHLIVKSGEELNVINEVTIEQDKKQKKMRLEQESRQIKQRSGPRVGKPRPAFGPSHPEERPLVLPGGRRWKGPKDVMNDQMIAETLQGQSEILQGKVMGYYESDILPYDERINFMKYEKPPVNLDHLQNSETYKLVHNMDQPRKRVELLTSVVAEADYREMPLHYPSSEDRTSVASGAVNHVESIAQKKSP